MQRWLRREELLRSGSNLRRECGRKRLLCSQACLLCGEAVLPSGGGTELRLQRSWKRLCGWWLCERGSFVWL